MADIDTVTVNDSPENAAAESPSENNVLLPDDLGSIQPRRPTVEEFPDSSASERLDLNEENVPSEGEEETHATFGDRAMEVSKQVIQCGEYLEEMAKQVTEWEEKIRKLVSKDNEAWKIPKGKKFGELPIIPKIHLVNWTDFKNKHMTQTHEYAIEVQIEEAKTYPRQYRDEKQNVDEGENNDFSQENLLGKTSSSPDAAPTYGHVPYQIRVNSKILLNMLSDLGSEKWTIEPTLMSRPFQQLAYYEPEIQKILDRLEEKWADIEKDQLVPGSPSHKPSSISFAAEEKKQLVAPESAAHSDTHAEVKAITKKSETVLEPLVEATPIDDEEGVKALNDNTLEQKMDSVEALRMVRCLMQFIKLYLRPYWNTFSSARCHKIIFVDLWHIFKSGDLVFAPLGADNDAEALNPLKNQRSTDSKSSSPSNSPRRYQTVWRVYYANAGKAYNTPQELELNKNHGKPKHWPLLLRCYYLDFNGEKVSAVLHDFRISAFQGEKDIDSLPIYPIKFAKNATKIEDQMRKRGQMFREFDTFSHRYYTGTSLVHQPSGDLIYNENNEPMHPDNIVSQVIVDIRGVLQQNPHWCPIFQNEITMDREQPVDRVPLNIWKDKDSKVLDHIMTEYFWHPCSLERRLAEDQKDREPFLRDDYGESPTTLANLRDEDLALLPARVFAYSFRNRKFVLLSVNSLSPVTPRVEGFNSLILPLGYKRTVQAIVRSHFSEKLSHQSVLREDDESDLVRGKGNGLIVLLHGAPGVGKTSTAECVAEANGRPLLPITCGDLGLVAEVVEQNLSRLFYLAERWDCVLLLDEADVFLAERTKSDLKRNSLVSVFLRILEYYTGILFLTTNRVGAIDPAFKSRIHMHLYYPPLSEKQTLAIWKVNLDRIKRRKKNMNIDVDEIMGFAINHFRESLPQNAIWNGRQIRNAFQTATALAEYDAWELNKHNIAKGDPADRPKLDRKHFELLAKTSLDFDLYMKETAAVNETERALGNSERADEFVPMTHHRNQRESENSRSRNLQHEQIQYDSGQRNALYQQNWRPGLTSATHQPYQPQPQQPMQSVRLASQEEQYSQRQYVAPDDGYSSFSTTSFNSTFPAASQPRSETILTHGEPLKVNARDNWQGPSHQFSRRTTDTFDEDGQYE